MFGCRNKEQEYCSRKCARLHQARHGIPSMEDKEARFVDGVRQLLRDVFGDK